MNKLYLITITLALLCWLSIINPSDTMAQASLTDISAIRSVTYYPFPAHWHDSNYANNLSTAIPKMKEQGFNCVWLFTQWKDFEPVALPQSSRQYNATSINNIHSVLENLSEHNMCGIVGLNYLGVGWSPSGIDATKWIFDESSFQAFREYTTFMVTELKDHPNLIYLTFAEASVPSDSGFTDPIVNQQFKDYLAAVNPQLSYWNTRWTPQYVNWDQIALHEVIGSPAYLEWSDHAIRPRLSEIGAIISNLKGRNQKVGYHWNFTGSTYENRLYTWTENNNPFDFQSFNFYPDSNRCPNNYDCMSHLSELHQFLQTLKPSRPIFLGELGMSSHQWINQNDLSRIITPILNYTQNEHLGINIWMWQDFDSSITIHKQEAFFGLYDLAYNPKPMLSVVKPYLTHFIPGDLNTDGKVDIFDYQRLISNFGNPYTIFDYQRVISNFGR